MSDLAYQHAAIQAMCGELKRLVNSIDNDLARDVESKFNVLLQAENFSGLAAESFRTASAAWNAKCLEMNQTLTQLELAVGNASTDMDAMDRKLQGLF
jgi:uncharacterized protein YukE